jgi:outer membrane beta-barrel protein
MKKTLVGFVILSLAAASAYAQSPNERVHVLQKRDYSVKNKLEISLFGGLSVDDIFTQHYAGTLAVDYHIDEAFALEAMWMSCKVPFYMGDAVTGTSPTEYKPQSDYDWVRFGHGYTDAYEEVHKDAQLSPSNADLAMISNYFGLNVQFSPIYGKWSFFGMGLGHADFYVTAGGGIATTEYQKANDNWVDTGTYFVGNFGLGFRIFLARWFAVRLDVRDFTFAARVRGDAGPATVGAVETKIRNTLFVMLGVSFLFLGEEPLEIWSPY